MVEPLTLHLEPRRESQLIAGRLRDGNGDEHHFTGWLALLTLLEQARRAAVAEGDRGGGTRR
jgi:hypothetical protein